MLDRFRENIHQARELGTLSQTISSMITAKIDVSDVWRAQIVLGVSALDYLIHEMVYLGVVECAEGRRPKTKKYKRLKISVDAVDLGLSGQIHSAWLVEEVKKQIAFMSYQKPDKIAEAISLISSIMLWECVGEDLGLSALEVVNRLEEIVERRNRIAHEADMDPSNPGNRRFIEPSFAKSSLDFIERIGESIHRQVFL